MLLDFLGLELWLVLGYFLLELLWSRNLAGFGGLISWANDYWTSYICSAQSIASQRLNLSYRSFSNIFSSKSNTLTVKLLSISAAQTSLALFNLPPVTSSLQSNPLYASVMLSSRLISSSVMPNQKIAHFQSSVIPKLANFSGEQQMLGLQLQRWLKSLIKGSMIFRVPFPKIRMFWVDRKMVPYFFSQGSGLSACSYLLNQSALRQLQRMLQRSQQLKYLDLMRSGCLLLIFLMLSLRTLISFPICRSEYSQITCSLCVVEQKDSSFYSTIYTNLVNS